MRRCVVQAGDGKVKEGMGAKFVNSMTTGLAARIDKTRCY